MLILTDWQFIWFESQHSTANKKSKEKIAAGVNNWCMWQGRGLLVVVKRVMIHIIW
jgi:hypothetical protein